MSSDTKKQQIKNNSETMFKTAIFDIDGTLCFSNYADDICYMQAFKDTFSFEITNSDWDSYKIPTETGIIEELCSKFLNRKPFESEIQKMVKRYVELIKIEFEKDTNCFQEVPGAINLIDYLRNNPKLFIGIATGGFGDSAFLKLSRVGFQLDNIPIAHNDDHKSKYLIIKSLIKRILDNKGLKNFDKIIYIGDREYDYRTANELNIDFIGVDFKKNGKLEKVGVKKIINNFIDKEFFLKLIN